MQFGRLILAASWLTAVSVSIPASAQVTTNNGALDALGKPEAKPRTAPVRRAPSRPVGQRPLVEQKPAPGRTPTPTATPAPKLPTVPVIPPAILALPPPVVVPLSHPPPTPTIPVSNDAPNAATPITNGVRVTFGADRTDLNPATVQILRDFARERVEQPAISINIYAYAAGSADDPSTPRRLSLERAMAARAVLMDAGIPSTRIYPRALGPLGGDALPDRIDVVAGAPTLAPASAASGRAG